MDKHLVLLDDIEEVGGEEEGLHCELGLGVVEGDLLGKLGLAVVADVDVDLPGIEQEGVGDLVEVEPVLVGLPGELHRALAHALKDLGAVEVA